MQRFYHLLGIVLVVGLFFSIAQPIKKVEAQVIPCTLGMCFGGFIDFISICDEGLVFEVYGVPFMWLYGTPIVGLPPNHIGQEILGAAAGFSICTIDGFPYEGGLIVLPLPFAGTALI
ncbi:MAG: hypothetical protein RLZZ347_647 [Candidatus Parcubacteria bacterium]|jgi:hypothetical protein